MFESFSPDQNKGGSDDFTKRQIQSAEALNQSNKVKIAGLERMLVMIEREEHPSETHQSDLVNIKIRIQEIRESIAENNRVIAQYQESSE